MANLRISKKSAIQKSSADTEWDAIEKVNPVLYDAIFKASNIMRKLEAAGKVRPFRVRHPTIRPAPPRQKNTPALKTKKTAYISQGAQQSTTVGGASIRGLSTSSLRAAGSTPRSDRSVSDNKYSSSGSGSYACKYCGKTYDTRDRRGIHEGKHLKG